MSKGSDRSETWNLTKQQTLKLRTMQGARERIMINITWRDRKNQSTRYHGNDKLTQNGIGLVMWLEEQTTIGQPALRSGRFGDTQGTEEDQGRDGGTTCIVL